MSRSNKKWPILLGLLAVLVRLFYLIEMSQRPGFLVPQIDELWHWEWAKEIATGSFWGNTAYFRAPLYPYFLSFLYFITNASIFWAKFLQLLLTFGTTVGIYALANYLFDRRVAMTSALIYIFYGTLIFYEAMFLIPVLFLPLTIWAMYRLVRYRNTKSVITWIVTGWIFGLAAISRPNILLTLPFLALWLWKTQSPGKWILKTIRTPVIMACGVILALAPVTIRNIVVTGNFTLISSQGGINLYLGNNSQATGLSMQMPEVTLDESVSWNHFLDATKAAAVKESGGPLSDAEASSFWTGKAIDWITSNPGDFFTLVWKKCVYLVSGFENSDNIEIYYNRQNSIVQKLLVWDFGLKFPFGLLLPLTLVGIWVTRKQVASLWPIYIFIAAYIPSIVLFLVTARHRLVLIPLMAMLAANGALWLWDKRRHLLHKTNILAPAILVVGLLASNMNFYRIGLTNEFQSYYNDGLKYLRMEDWVEAEKAFLKADTYYQYSAPLLNNLGWVQYNLGKLREADESYRRAIQADGNFSKAYNNLGLLVEKQGRPDSAAFLYQRAIQLFDSTRADISELGQYYLNAADVYAKTKKDDTAAALYERALQISPEEKSVYFKAALFHARRKEFEQSDSLFARGARLGEPKATHFFNWGLTVLERGEYEGGIKLMQKAINRDTIMYDADYCIAAAYKQLGSPPDSVNKYLQRCLRLNPGYPPALRLQQDISQQPDSN